MFDWTERLSHFNGGEITENVIVRLAGNEDLPEIRDLLAEGGRFIVAQGGKNAWPDPFPAERVTPLLDAQCVYVARSDRHGTVGTITIVDEDQPFWGDRPRPSAHLHRLAVRRSLAGQGIGRQMVEWAIHTVARQGIPRLRLECLFDAARLRAFYESLGFLLVGAVDDQGYHLALYEREVQSLGGVFETGDFISGGGLTAPNP